MLQSRAGADEGPPKQFLLVPIPQTGRLRPGEIQNVPGRGRAGVQAIAGSVPRGHVLLITRWALAEELQVGVDGLGGLAGALGGLGEAFVVHVEVVVL